MFSRLAIVICLALPNTSLAQIFDGCGTDTSSADEAQLNCMKQISDLLASIDSIERALILQISSINQDTSDIAALTADGYFPVDAGATHDKLDALADLLSRQNELLSTISDQFGTLPHPPTFVSTLISLDAITSCPSSAEGQPQDECISAKLDQVASDFCSVQPSSKAVSRIIPDINHAVISCTTGQ